MKINSIYLFSLIYFIIGISTVSAQDQQTIDSLKSANINESNLETLVDNYNELSYFYGLINLDSSLNYSYKAMDLAEEINYTSGLALSHLYSARSLMEKDAFKKAIEQFNKSLNLFIELNDSVDILNCYRGLAYLYSYGSQIKSLDYDFKALKIAEGIHDSTSLAIIYNNIGAIYTRLDNYEAAIKNYNKTIAIEERAQVPIDLAISHSNVGMLKLQHDKLKEAIPNYNMVLSLLPKIENSYSISYLFLSLSRYYTELGLYDSAEYYIDRTNTILAENPYKHIKVRALRREAYLHFKQKEYRKSIDCFNACLQLSKSIGVNESFPEIYKMIGEAYYQLDMYKKAYDFSQLSSSANDSLKRKKIAGFLAEFENEQTLKESERQILEQELKDRKLENDRIRMKFEFTIAVTIIVLLILTVLIVIYLFFRIRKTNRTLKSQNDVINDQKLLLEKSVQKLTLSENSLKKMNTTKDKLYSIIAHDLRNPFNSILGLSELLLEDENDFDAATYKEYLSIINLSAQNTLALLDNLLNWAKSQSEEFHFNPERIGLSSIISETVELSHLASIAKNIALVHNESEEYEVYADADMVKTVLRNLISNAIKFTNPGGTITVSTEKKVSHVEISVSDTGVGMSQEVIDKLFQIETNKTTVGTANEAGSGLGLILCKEFIEKQNGKISVESTPGKGSKFIFTLPTNS